MIRSVIFIAMTAGLASLVGCGSSAPPDNGVDVATAFLADIRDGKVDSAWESTTAEFKSFMGKERLRIFVRQHPVLKKPAKSAGAQVVSVQGLSRNECTFRPESGTENIKVLLAVEDGTWRVERLNVE